MLRIQEIGKRAYVVGNSFAIKDALKSAGCHWDGDRRQWWIGAGKRASLDAIISQPAPSAESQEADRLQRDQKNIIGTANFDGKSYYLVGSGSNDKGGWVRLMFRDGSKTFFKSSIEVQITKTYQRAQTLSGLQEYADRRKREAAGGQCECWCHTPRNPHCSCESSGFCSFHHDGCDSCGCES